MQQHTLEAAEETAWQTGQAQVWEKPLHTWQMKLGEVLYFLQPSARQEQAKIYAKYGLTKILILLFLIKILRYFSLLKSSIQLIKQQHPYKLLHGYKFLCDVYRTFN